MIVVTGGCGFIGRNLVRSLIADENVSVLVIDDLSVGRHPDQWLEAELIMSGASPPVALYKAASGATIEFIFADLAATLPQLWEDRFTANGMGDTCEEVYHLAARVGGRLSLEAHPFSIAENLTIDRTFFHWTASNAARIERVLYMSSSAAYPLTLQMRSCHQRLSEDIIDTTSPMETDGIYGWSKLTGEFLARQVARKYDVSVACVRPFSGYGGDQDLTYPIPALASRAAAEQNPLLVWGSGEQARDFIHISDCIAGMRRTISAIGDGTAVNLGTGVGTTLADAARMLAEIRGYTPDIKVDVTKPEGAEVRVADTQRMSELLSWEPEVALADGLRSVLGTLR